MNRTSATQRRRAGLVVAAGCLLVLLVLFTRAAFLPGVGDTGTTVRLAVTSSSSLEAGDPVRVRGVEVGKVDGIEQRGDGAVVRLKLDTALPHRDAGAQLRWRTFLGGAMFVDLDPGSPQLPRLTGTLPASRTSTQVELDDLFSAFTAPTREGIRTTLGTTAAALQQRPPVRRALQLLGPALDTADRGLQPLRGRQRDDLAALVDAGGRTLAALGRSERALADVADGGAATLSTVARRRRDLGRAIGQLPATLRATDATLTRLRRTLDDLDPLAARLTLAVAPMAPALRPLRATALKARRLLRSVRPLLTAFPAALEPLARAARSGSVVLADLTPILRRTREQLLPWLDTPDPSTRLKLYEAIGPTASAGTHGEFDAGGYFLPFPAAGDPRSLYDLPCQVTADINGATELAQCQTLTELLGLLGTPPPTKGHR